MICLALNPSGNYFWYTTYGWRYLPIALQWTGNCTDTIYQSEMPPLWIYRLLVDFLFWSLDLVTSNPVPQYLLLWPHNTFPLLGRTNPLPLQTFHFQKFPGYSSGFFEECSIIM